jgi:hypothetical protein
MKALVQREGSLIKPRQSQNRISGFSTESANPPSSNRPHSGDGSNSYANLGAGSN